MAVLTGDHSWGIAVVLLLTYTCQVLNATRCFDCSGQSSPYDCTTVRRCRADEQCFTRAYVNDAYSIMYDLGCQSNDFCSVVPRRSLAQDREMLDLTYAQLALVSGAANTSVDEVIMGFSHEEEIKKKLGGTVDEESESSSHTVQKRQYEIPLCTKCCTGDHCNVELCRSTQISRPQGLRCYDCGMSSLVDPVQCNNVRICSSSEECRVKQVFDFFAIKYQVTCDSQDRCADTGSNIPFGKRDVSSEDYDVREVDEDVELNRSERQAQQCFTCCDRDYCNIDYCSKERPLPQNITTVATTVTTTMTTMSTSTAAPRLDFKPVQFPTDLLRETNTVPVRYVCQVEALPIPAYRWILEPDVDITSRAYLSPDGKASTLDIDPVKPSDEGNYTCVASNAYETKNFTGELTVYSPLMLVAAPLADRVVKEGDNVTLDCRHSAYPLPSYEWVINLDSGVNDTDNSKMYTLDNVTRDESGTYTCNVENSRENTTQSMRLDVQFKPDFSVKFPDSINTTLGMNFTLRCPVDANPAPVWTFMFIDEDSFPVILSNAQANANSDTLFIANMTEEYTGTYTCYARNDIGISKQDVMVNVVP